MYMPKPFTTSAYRIWKSWHWKRTNDTAAQDKGQPQWEAEVIDPVSKFVVSHVQGQRDEALIRRLLEDAARRLANRHELVLFTDGEASYASLFPEIFGQAYRPSRQGNSGRFPDLRYRIPRTLAHV